MDTALLGINVLLGYAIWRFVWRKSALDLRRDRLFDLREEVRSFFVTNGYGIEHPIYIELRRLINGHIRYMESLTLRLYIAETVAFNKHPETARQLVAQLNDKFSSADPILSAFVKSVRGKAVLVLLGYMAETSLGFIILSALSDHGSDAGRGLLRGGEADGDGGLTW